MDGGRPGSLAEECQLMNNFYTVNMWELCSGLAAHVWPLSAVVDSRYRAQQTLVVFQVLTELSCLWW